jgi:hypothetical protein
MPVHEIQKDFFCLRREVVNFGFVMDMRGRWGEIENMQCLTTACRAGMLTSRESRYARNDKKIVHLQGSKSLDIVH